jgi:hypothetical protein
MSLSVHCMTLLQTYAHRITHTATPAAATAEQCDGTCVTRCVRSTIAWNNKSICCTPLQVTTLLLFAVPMCAMTGLYVAMALVIRRSVSNSTGSNSNGQPAAGRTSYRHPVSPVPGRRPARRTALRILGQKHLTFFSFSCLHFCINRSVEINWTVTN